MDAKGFNDFKFLDAFSTWELQSGYPVIHVNHDKDLNEFRITQKRYLNSDSNSVDSSSWFIPLNFAHANHPDFDDTITTHYFENGSNVKIISTQSIEGFDVNGWFVFNKQQLNYYRVNYDFENWHNIIKVLNSENYQSIHVMNRAQLVDDALNFAFDGFINFDVALGVLTYLHHETDNLPWASVNNYLERIDNLLSGTATRASYHEFLRHLVSRMYARHGIQQSNGEAFLTKAARELAINWSCRTGNIKCQQETYAEIKQAMTERREIPKPLEIAFLCNGLKGENKSEEFVYFWRKMRESSDQADRLRLIDGLSCSDDSQNIKSFLESSTARNSDVDYRLHERTRIFYSVLSSSSIGISSILNFMSNDINEILVA